MEYFYRNNVCREFLNQYNDSLFPELLPKLMKVAIYVLQKTFHKLNISIKELDQFINNLNFKKLNLELESNFQDKPPYPPYEKYLTPNISKLERLKMGFHPPEKESNSKIGNSINDNYGYGKLYPNDEINIIGKNNFYDENYYIPRNRTYRNYQLYNRRLKDPQFITQEKKIYPYWWWNLKDDIEQEDYSENDSDIDHRPSGYERFPKDIEEKIKKKLNRYKSFNSTKPIPTHFYEESKDFSYAKKTENNNDNFNFDLENDYSPSDIDLRCPYGRTYTKGFGRKIFKDNINNMDNFDINNSLNLSNNSPLYSSSQNPYYETQVNNLRKNNKINEINRPEINFENNLPGNGNIDFDSYNKILNENFRYDGTINRNINNTPYNMRNNLSKSLGKGTFDLSSNLNGTNSLKDKIMKERRMRNSYAFSYDKDFNIIKSMIKKKGKIKKGIKYSLSGNELKEDKKGIIRRRKK